MLLVFSSNSRFRDDVGDAHTKLELGALEELCSFDLRLCATNFSSSIISGTAMSEAVQEIQKVPLRNTFVEEEDILVL